MTDAAWANLIGQLGIGAVLAFFMWHLISKSVPDLIAGFRDELRSERVSCREQHAATVAAIKELTTQLDKLAERVEAAVAHAEHCPHWRPAKQPNNHKPPEATP